MLALLISVVQVQGHGLAHWVITSANPASLPPTDTETYAVLALRLPSWFSTSGTRAPEQAAKVSGAPRRWATSTG